MLGETSLVKLVIIVVVFWVAVVGLSFFVVVGLIDVNVEIGLVFVDIDELKVVGDVDVDIISIAVSSRTLVSLQKSMGLSFEAEDILEQTRFF